MAIFTQGARFRQVLVFALVVLGAASREAPAAEAPPLVFVHGIKGAELVTAGGDVRWLTAWEALGLSTPDLSLQPRFDNGFQPSSDLHPGKVLSSVLTADIYGPFLEAAASFGQPFYPFSYDWRRDNLETLSTLIGFLETVKARHGGARVQVVAHSMGGLLTLAALNRRPDLFDAVVFAGVPFGGGVGFLPDLQIGDPTGLNDGLMAPAVVATFPSVFCFFPLADNGYLLDKAGSPIVADFYAPGTWRRLRLGPYLTGEAPAGYDAFFTEALGRAKHFRELIAKTSIAYPRILIVAGKSQPTLSQAVQDDGADHGWAFKTAPHEPGDGRVGYAKAKVPAGIPAEEILTANDHASLLNDPEIIAAIRKFLAPR